MWEYLYGIGITPEHCYTGIKLCGIAACISVIVALCADKITSIINREE